MWVSWYLPTLSFSLWPCVILLVIFIPISIWHERNWRRTLADYAIARREAGAVEEDWPPRELARLMSIQPWLLFVVSGMLGVTVTLAAWAAMLWPHRPPGFQLPLNPYDLPYVWSMVVAGIAAVCAGVAVAMDLKSHPMAQVANQVRRSMYVSAAERAERFARALQADPGVPHDAST